MSYDIQKLLDRKKFFILLFACVERIQWYRLGKLPDHPSNVEYSVK
jgi:hypothetical protein